MEFPIEMYKIREEDVKITVPCEYCSTKGFVNKNCSRCGGHGKYKKTIKAWKVAPKTVTVEKINRTGVTEAGYLGYVGDLRYWISNHICYSEKEKILHFTKDDAQGECDKRNKELLKENCSKIKTLKMNMEMLQAELNLLKSIVKETESVLK